jgi:nitroimidazol reductase NimA-like FMN-containing flavoprotein (pyridoxamine 5'-phosphate oxidase superfamily)
MSLAMTGQERERFLADVHVGIISIPEEGRGSLSVPVWYAYELGNELRVMTGRTSRKGRLLERARRFSLCVQKETPPYKYVSVEGPIVAIEPANLDRDLRPLAHRYLGRKPATATWRARGRTPHTATMCSFACVRIAG